MPATPAWPPKSLPRLFVRHELSEGVTVELDAGQANYLGNVMRLGVGTELLVFDGFSGEWLARIGEAAKKRMTLTVDGEVRQSASSGDMTWGVDELVRFIDERTSFDCGDLLFTGSPEGVGQGTGKFLKPGEVMETMIEGIGKLRNVIGAKA